MVAHHGYVRARRIRPERPLCAGITIGGLASTEVEWEVKSIGELLSVHGQRQSGGRSNLACPWGEVPRAPLGGVQLVLSPSVGRCMLNSHAGLSWHVGY